MTISSVWSTGMAALGDSIVNVCRSAGRTRDRGAIRTARRSDWLYRPGYQSGHAPGGAPTFDASLIPARVNPPGEQDLAGWLGLMSPAATRLAASKALAAVSE